MGPLERIRTAATATGKIQVEIEEAREALDDAAFGINSLGVYKWPSAARGTLAAAREAIERAEKIMAETQWPEPTDYDAV